MKKVLYQGDEHLRYVATAIKNGMMTKNYEHIVHDVGGATTSTLDNPLKKIDTISNFKTKLEETKPDVLILHMGEVDCSFNFWYRNLHQDLPIEDMVIDSIQNYAKYIEYAKQHVKRIIVTAPTLPAMKDVGLDPSLSGKFPRRNILATQAMRTGLTFTYSDILQAHCAELGVPYITFNRSLLKGDVIDDRFLTNDHFIHILNDDIMAGLWSKKLNTLLDSYHRIDR